MSMHSCTVAPSLGSFHLSCVTTSPRRAHDRSRNSLRLLNGCDITTTTQLCARSSPGSITPRTRAIQRWRSSSRRRQHSGSRFNRGTCSFSPSGRIELTEWRCGIRKVLVYLLCKFFIEFSGGTIGILRRGWRSREVHVSDLIRAHEGNPDSHPTDPTKIHWAKFNMIGKFIHTTTQYQQQCRSSEDYLFPERPEIRDLLMRECVMDPDVSRKYYRLPTHEPY